MMLEDICIDAIVDNVEILSDYAKRLPRFLAKKVTVNTINYRGTLHPRKRRQGSDGNNEARGDDCDVGGDVASLDAICEEAEPEEDSRLKLKPPQPPPHEHSRLGSLATELILNILSYLSHKDLLCVGQVCQQLHQLASDSFLWKRLCLEASPHCGGLSEELVRQITFENLDALFSGLSPSLASAPAPASALKLRRKGKKKTASQERARWLSSDHLLQASTDKYSWKYFFFLGLHCCWHLNRLAHSLPVSLSFFF